MITKKDKNQARKVRHLRVRKKISGTADCPRLCVYRSLNGIYAQLIDDTKGFTLVSASTQDAEIKALIADKTKTEIAKEVGKLVGRRAIEKGCKTVVFDRGGYLYTGRVAALADGAREAGLEL